MRGGTTSLEGRRTTLAVGPKRAAATWEDLVIPLDDAIDRLGRAWGLVDHLQAVCNTPELRQVYSTQLPKVSEFWSRMTQNDRLFEQYRCLDASADALGLDLVRRRVIEHALRNFHLGGVALAPDQKARFGELRSELAALSARFSDNVLDATDAFSLNLDEAQALSGVPADIVAACKQAAMQAGQDGYRLTLPMPCYWPVLAYAEDRQLRRTLYLANIVRASELDSEERDYGPLIERIVALRAEMAALLDLPSYSDYSLATKMAGSAAEVLAFLRELAGRALPRASNERAEVEEFARGELGLDSLEPWDLAYASEKLKSVRYSFSPQEVKQYFVLDNVLEGLFGLIHSLYGVKVEEDQAPAWHDDVRFYRFIDAEGRLLGQCYFDLFARTGKRGGAWMNVCRNRQRRGGQLRTSLVYLICNFGRAANGTPTTLSHEDVITLFHEMGHGLHQLLTEVDEAALAGINGVEWDAVELPSQFMENFCWEIERVERMTAHVETKTPLPRSLFDRMAAAKNFMSGMGTLRQVEFSLLDMMLHANSEPGSDNVLALHKRIRGEVGVNPAHPDDRFPYSFGHIFAGGYAAGYYSYKWAEVLSADAYAAFEEAPGLEALTGARFRREVLARGGSRSAADNFRAFGGRDPDMAALLRHLGIAA